MQPKRKNKTKCLSYEPPENELPFYESVFHYADIANTGNQIQVEAARKVLSLSSISRDDLDMIIHMVTINNAYTLTRQQFYVAVRLIQFRQNNESVKNLRLTVPDNVRLNPPYFKNIDSNGTIIRNSCFKNNPELCGNPCLDFMSHEDQSSNRSSNISSSDLVLECNELRKELDKLKEKLTVSNMQLNALTKHNTILKENANIIERIGEKDCEEKECFSQTYRDQDFGEVYINHGMSRNRSCGSLISDITMDNDDYYSRNKKRSLFPYQSEDVMASLFKTDKYNNILNTPYKP